MDDNAKFRSFEDINAAAARGEVTEAEARKFISDYSRAYAEEFDEKLNQPPPDQRIRTATELFKDNAVDAAKQIIYLMHHAESESVQLNASKYISERSKEDPGTASEMDELFAKLTNASSR